MVELQEVVTFSVVVAVVVVFLVYFYYQGERITDDIDELNPFIWTAQKFRLDVCDLPFSNLTGKCMDADFCHYEVMGKFRKNLLNCKIFTDFVCCPTNDSVLEDPILKQFITRKVVDPYQVELVD